ncbi:MAG: hypothetical protein ACJ8FS_04870 [Sphingomicrobium sp.]
MSDQSNAEYFAKRARAERAMISRSTDPRVAAVHAEMAERYEQMAEGFPLKLTELSIAS